MPDFTRAPCSSVFPINRRLMISSPCAFMALTPIL
jgi:hypothetical protein